MVKCWLPRERGVATGEALAAQGDRPVDSPHSRHGIKGIPLNNVYYFLEYFIVCMQYVSCECFVLSKYVLINDMSISMSCFFVFKLYSAYNVCSNLNKDFISTSGVQNVSLNKMFVK